jgi:hypothetical protein
VLQLLDQKFLELHTMKALENNCVRLLNHFMVMVKQPFHILYLSSRLWMNFMLFMKMFRYVPFMKMFGYLQFF